MNDNYLIANLNLPINERKSVDQRKEEAYNEKLSLLESIKASFKKVVEQEFDNTPFDGNRRRYLTTGHEIGTF